MSLVTDRIGATSESIVRIACERLKERGKIKSYPRVDNHGMDFLIIVSHWQAMPLQVKTSWFSAGRHYRKYPRIPVIVIHHRSPQMNKRRKRRLVEHAEFHILKLINEKRYTVPFMAFPFVFIRTFQSRHAA